MKTKLFFIIIAAAFLTQLYLIVTKPKLPSVQLHLKEQSFAELPNWANANKQTSLHAFQISCRAFLKQDPNKSIGSQYIDLKVKDWHPVCKAAMLIDTKSEAAAQTFFETWFKPVEFYLKKPVTGLFTGYYMPLLKGSLTKTEQYQVPIYNVPSNLITANLELFDSSLKHRRINGRIENNRLVPYYTREEINHGAIDKLSSVIVWVDSQLQRLILEIEGSGVVQLPDGKKIGIGYAGENGVAYTSIASVLIHKNVMTRDNASMQHIYRYFNEHPEEITPVLNQNKSFVFFTKLANHDALGAQGVPLTPGYSLAIDRKWIPIGAPLWLSTTRPDHALETQKPFHRLMIAQDTGGAIRGAVRGDVYWGEGEKATEIAGKMKNPGRYWLLLPRHVVIP